MFRILLLFSSAVFLFSCGSVTKIEVSEIESISFEYSSSQNLNFGKTITGRFIAHLYDGKDVDVTDSRKFSYTSSDIKRIDATEQYLIVKKPNHFHDRSISISMSYTDKEETFTKEQAISMNFNGDLLLLLGGEDGDHGIDQKDKGSKLIGRNGKNGENGTNGSNGTSSNTYEAYIWQEGDTAYILVKDLSFPNRYAYKCLNFSSITFDISGGDGGNGG
ncbi:MAG: hypothetical protein EP333_06895, partial [Bacteroidetes bacterium]